MKLDALRLAFKFAFGFSFIFPAVSFCCWKAAESQVNSSLREIKLKQNASRFVVEEEEEVGFHSFYSVLLAWVPVHLFLFVVL